MNSVKDKVQHNHKASAKHKIERKPFGNLDSEEINLYTLTNVNGNSISISNYGGIVTSIKMPDKNKIKKNLVIGFDFLDSYLKYPAYFGAIVGRYSNRILDGRFKIDNRTYQLTVNEKENHLHGGHRGFDKRIWECTQIEGDDYVGLQLTYLSKAMEEGYPGNVHVQVIYKLTDNDQVSIDYSATTDKKTIINLTQHSYFNLSGNQNSDILSHYLKVHADYYLPINNKLIPMGRIVTVDNTPFDFKQFHKIGARINDDNEQLKFAKGYDHAYVLNKKNEALAAEVYDEKSGRLMQVYTSKPSIQFYTSNSLSALSENDDSILFNNHSAFCLETQYYPNSPNENNFPLVFLSPGETYKQSTIYKFSVKSN